MNASFLARNLPSSGAARWREDEDGTLSHPSRALLFDLDGTLVDSAAAIDRHTRAWAHRCGLDGDRVLQLSHGLRDTDLIAALAPTRDQQEEAAWLHRLSCDDTRGIGPVAGAAALLSGLAPENWAVVTSGAREVARARLAAAGLPLPRVLVAAEDVAKGKPAPECYLLAAERLGQEPDACVAFEDADVGVSAARAAGMMVVRIGAGDPPCVADLREVSVTASRTALGGPSTVHVEIRRAQGLY